MDQLFISKLHIGPIPIITKILSYKYNIINYNTTYYIKVEQFTRYTVIIFVYKVESEIPTNKYKTKQPIIKYFILGTY